MSRATVERDFFGRERESTSKSQFRKFLDRQKSFRGMQSAISKIDPEVLKSVIASGSVNRGNPVPSQNSVSVPPSPAFSVFTPPKLRPSSESLSNTAPLTIFYNGTVSVFDTPKDKAETILKLALDATSDTQQLLETLNEDVPIARRKSLQRFLEKRKERLTLASPYACSTKYAFSPKKEAQSDANSDGMVCPSRVLALF